MYPPDPQCQAAQIYNITCSRPRFDHTCHAVDGVVGCLFAPSDLCPPPPSPKKHSQMMVDQFWAHFIRSNLLTLQVQQKWEQLAHNRALDSVLMNMDLSLSPIGLLGRSSMSVQAQMNALDQRKLKSMDGLTSAL